MANHAVICRNIFERHQPQADRAGQIEGRFRQRPWRALHRLIFVAGAGFLGWRFGRIANVLHARWLPDGDVLWSAPWAARSR